MVDHDTLAGAYDRLGLDIKTAEPEQLAGLELSEPARLVLTEVGLPQAFGDHVVLRNLAKGPTIRDGLIYLGAGRHDKGILLNGATGEVLARQADGTTRRISPRPETFVEYLYLMQAAMNESDDRGLRTPEQFAQLRQDLYARMATADPEAMSEAGDYWRDMFEYTY